MKSFLACPRCWGTGLIRGFGGPCDLPTPLFEPVTFEEVEAYFRTHADEFRTKLAEALADDFPERSLLKTLGRLMARAAIEIAVRRMFPGFGL